MEAIKLISKQGLRAEICSASRGDIGDINDVLRSGADSIAMIIPTSDLHLKYKMNKNREELLRITEKCVQYSKDHGLVVELLAEDGTRTNLSFLTEVFNASISVGADRICACDTVGILTPEKSHNLFSHLRNTFPKTPISVHCHNDLGLAVANSIVALKAGADQVHATINGIGERAGNAALEEVVMALETAYETKTTIKTEHLYPVSKLVAQLTGIPVQPNKAIVGDNAFTHESGIHTHAVLLHPSTYEPITPESVGFNRRLVAGKHAGTHGIRASLNLMGLHSTDRQLGEIFKEVKNLGDTGKTVTDADLQTIAENALEIPRNRPIQLNELTTIQGNRITSTASVNLTLNGKTIREAATGVGPVDAAMKAVRKAISPVESIQLEQYHVEAITGGTNANVKVIIRLRKGDRTATAKRIHKDIVMASVEAMLNGMNVLLANYQKND